MRRLTDKEKTIVEFISKKKDTTIKRLIRKYDYYDSNISIKVRKDSEFIDVWHLTNSEENVQDIKKIVKKGMILEAESYVMTLMELVQLITLLKENNLIYLLDMWDLNNDVPRSITGEKTAELNDRVLTEYIGDVFKGLNAYHFCLNLREYSQVFYHTTVSNIYSTPALEIYVKAECRTEEQKENDKTEVHNRRTTIISWFAVGAAIAAVIVSGYFSYLSYSETSNSKNEEKDKDKITEFYRGEVISKLGRLNNSVDSIRVILKP